MARITPPTVEYYWLPMPDLDKIVTEIYGEKYVGQQTGGCLPEGSITYHMDEFEVEEILYRGDDSEEDNPYYDPPDFYDSQDRVYFTFEAWLARDRSQEQFEFQGYRQAPTPDIALATLIKNDHLPYGSYLVSI